MMTSEPSGRDPIFGRPASMPYAGGTGSTGSGASHERREREDESGISAYRQGQVLGLLRAAGTTGLTWSELGDKMEPKWHHGQSTGALSVLHKDDQIAALVDRRKRSTIYVLKEFVAGRRTRSPGQTRGNRELAEVNAELQRENGALAQQIENLREVLGERDQELAETNSTVDEQAAAIRNLAARLRTAEQQAALGVEQMTRLDAERASLQISLSAAMGQNAAATEQIATLEQINHALRVWRALVELGESERALHERIGARLAEDAWANGPDTAPVRVTLGALRTMWTAMGRLVPDRLPTRERPGLPAGPEESGPAVDPGV